MIPISSRVTRVTRENSHQRHHKIHQALAMAAIHRNRPIPAHTGLPTNHTARPRHRGDMDRPAEHMAGKTALLARTPHLLVASMAARQEAGARMARPTRRRWASQSPLG